MFMGYFFTKNCKRFAVLLSLLGGLMLGAYGQTNTGKTDLKLRLFNLEGPASEVFRYYATITNNGAEPQVYALDTQLPPGWSIDYKVEGMSVTSVQLDPQGSKEVTLEITPSFMADVKKHAISFRAITQRDTLVAPLEAVIKGVYKLGVATKNEVLSGDMTTGSTKEIVLVIKNQGSLPLEGLELSAQLPTKWEAQFDNSKIDKLAPGATQEVKVNVKVPEKTIAGDYMTTFSVKNQQTQADLSYRMEIKTSLWTGWLGMLLMLLSVGLIYYLVRKYGRR